MTWALAQVIVFAALALGGWGLSLWATLELRKFHVIDLRPQPFYTRVTTGPYRWFDHPMYVGHVALVTGLFGLACGWWGAIAGWKVSELLVREWASREFDRSTPRERRLRRVAR